VIDLDMDLKDKIYIAGHRGLVGSAIVRQLESRGFTNLLVRTRKELDLTNQANVQEFFKRERPDHVILAAGKVGGIYSNSSFPADFIYQNLMIEANVIHASYVYHVRRLLFISSTSIYPKNAEQPVSEEQLLTGPLEPTNEPYSIAKIAGIKLCESYNRQYKTDFRVVVPSNLYGIGDTFHAKNSHVVPSLIQRFHNAKINNEKVVSVWGTGNVLREFLYIDDMAQALLFILELDKDMYTKDKTTLSQINIGTGIEITIRELAEIIKQVTGFTGEIVFDSTKPDGIKRKLANIDKLTDLGWVHKVSLRKGIEKTYRWEYDNSNNI
jgi:GDP-L-fucose synthase